MQIKEGGPIGLIPNVPWCGHTKTQRSELLHDHISIRLWVLKKLICYLHRLRHSESPLCTTRPNNEETPEYVMLVCSRFREVRREMLEGGAGNLDNIVVNMCQDEIIRNAVNRAIMQIMSSLQRK